MAFAISQRQEANRNGFTLHLEIKQAPSHGAPLGTPVVYKPDGARFLGGDTTVKFVAGQDYIFTLTSTPALTIESCILCTGDNNEQELEPWSPAQPSQPPTPPTTASSLRSQPAQPGQPAQPAQLVAAGTAPQQQDLLIDLDGSSSQQSAASPGSRQLAPGPLALASLNSMTRLAQPALSPTTSNPFAGGGGAQPPAQAQQLPINNPFSGGAQPPAQAQLPIHNPFSGGAQAPTANPFMTGNAQPAAAQINPFVGSAGQTAAPTVNPFLPAAGSAQHDINPFSDSVNTHPPAGSAGFPNTQTGPQPAHINPFAGSTAPDHVNPFSPGAQPPGPHPDMNPFIGGATDPAAANNANPYLARGPPAPPSRPQPNVNPYLTGGPPPPTILQPVANRYLAGAGPSQPARTQQNVNPYLAGGAPTPTIPQPNVNSYLAGAGPPTPTIPQPNVNPYLAGGLPQPGRPQPNPVLNPYTTAGAQPPAAAQHQTDINPFTGRVNMQPRPPSAPSPPPPSPQPPHHHNNVSSPPAPPTAPSPPPPSPQPPPVSYPPLPPHAADINPFTNSVAHAAAPEANPFLPAATFQPAAPSLDVNPFIAGGPLPAAPQPVANPFQPATQQPAAPSYQQTPHMPLQHPPIDNPFLPAGPSHAPPPQAPTHIPSATTTSPFHTTPTTTQPLSRAPSTATTTTTHTMTPQPSLAGSAQALAHAAQALAHAAAQGVGESSWVWPCDLPVSTKSNRTQARLKLLTKELGLAELPLLVKIYKETDKQRLNGSRLRHQQFLLVPHPQFDKQARIVSSCFFSLP